MHNSFQKIETINVHIIWTIENVGYRQISDPHLGFRPYQNVDIRNRTVPPLPNYSVENFVGFFIVGAEDADC